MAVGNRSPIFASIRYSMPVSGSTSCTRLPNMFRYTSARAPLSLNWWRISRSVYSGLVLTTIRPARRAPNTAMGYCSTLGICTAMRSPGLRSVCCCNQAAKAAEWRSSSA
ncbi:hypothetical protein D3C76_1237560 [compost metagenome]